MTRMHPWQAAQASDLQPQGGTASDAENDDCFVSRGYTMVAGGGELRIPVTGWGSL